MSTQTRQTAEDGKLKMKSNKEKQKIQAKLKKLFNIKKVPQRKNEIHTFNKKSQKPRNYSGKWIETNLTSQPTPNFKEPALKATVEKVINTDGSEMNKQNSNSVAKNNLKNKKTQSDLKVPKEFVKETNGTEKTKNSNVERAKKHKNTDTKLTAIKRNKVEPLQKSTFGNVDSSEDDEDYFVDSEEEAQHQIIDEYLEHEMLENQMYDSASDVEEEEEYDSDEEYESEEENDYDSYSEDDTWDEEEESYEYDNTSYKTQADDLIIHQGTAIKHALDETEGSLNFDSDYEGTQLIELPNYAEIQTINQDAEYDREVLIKRSSEFVRQLNVNDDKTYDENECPELVPINKKQSHVGYENSANDLETYEDESNDDDKYEEITDSDVWSYEEESIVDKYEHSFGQEEKCHKPVKVQVHVIKAKGKINNVQTQFMEETNNADEEHIELLTPDAEQSQAEIITVDSNDSVENAKTKVNLPVEIAKVPAVNESRSNFLYSHFFTTINSRYVLVVLKKAIFCYGTLRFKLIAGKIDVFGYNPPLNEEFELFSTRGCSALSLKPLKSKLTVSPNLKELLQQHMQFHKIILEAIEACYEAENDALVLMKRNEERSDLVSQYKRYMNENLFPNLQAQNPKHTMHVIEQQLNCHLNSQSMQALQMPISWTQLPLTNNMRMLLTGGKSVGKSTILRYLLNRLLSKNESIKQTGVLLIDLDVGQAELSAPQMISCTLMYKPLLGPGFFLSQATDRAYFVGEVNVTLCAQRYLRAIKMLAAYCKTVEAYANVPWLINTMGYNQGIGTEIIAAICEQLQPTDVVQIQSNVQVNNFPQLLHPNLLRNMLNELYDCGTLASCTKLTKYNIPDYHLHLLNAAVPQESRYQREWSMSAKDLRHASLLAQMSNVLLDESSCAVDSTPWCAALTDIKVISLSDPNKPLEELQQALTANVVYLCQRVTDDQTPMQCFGIGIVRSVDENHIYIMPAAGKQHIQSVNCVALSEQPLPTANLKRQSSRVKHTYLPFVYTSGGHASTAVKQIYRRPVQFLKGKHRKLIA